LALGATSAVGSTYNFAAPIYHRLMAAFAQRDLAAARLEQGRSVRLVELLARYGYMAAAKTVMSFLGVEVGPARLPHGNLTDGQRNDLRRSLDEQGFFEWIKP
jgi:N-acetylneuraminate lyase